MLLFFIVKYIFYDVKADMLLFDARVYQLLYSDDIPILGMNPDSPVWKGSFKVSRGP